jgi:xylan 1,4-beta-xylosidase
MFLSALVLTLMTTTTLSSLEPPKQGHTWTADNGNGTFSNPLFFDEFSDPDLIRVGDDYYLTGTTMHAMPGLPILHSRDLVNWDLLGYAVDRLDYGPQYRLEDGKSIYGQGIWAPCLRYHNGTFYIFTNVNGRATQIFSAKNPKGPWAHREMKRGLHDLSVLFDDDGKAYVVWGYRDLHIAQLNETLDDLVPGTEHTPFGPDSLIGEGSHFYKIDGKYIITSAWYAGRMRMACARADSPFGPYELNPEISADESFGLTSGNRLGRDFQISPLNPNGDGSGIAMHQGGIVQTQKGEWWGWSMMDANSVGRLTCLSPVTWKDGWPFFGLPGNLGRTPRTWVKPNTGHRAKPKSPYVRNDDFNGPKLANAWQWNHAPANDHWSLTSRPGFLRLHALPAADFFAARNTLTQRAVGPVSTPTVELDTDSLKVGDTAGLGILNWPYAWVGVRKGANGSEIVVHDQRTGKEDSHPFAGGRIWLRADCDFLMELGRFSYSLDGTDFQPMGEAVKLVFQLKTFQGIRYGLFCFGEGGGYADFTQFRLDEHRPTALTRPIPYGKSVRLVNLADTSLLRVQSDNLVSQPGFNSLSIPADAEFQVIDAKLGRVALEAHDGRRITVDGDQVSLAKPKRGESQAFQWTEMPRGDLLLLSLASHRYLRVTRDGLLRADAPGAQYNRQNGASFNWQLTR